MSNLNCPEINSFTDCLAFLKGRQHAQLCYKTTIRVAEYDVREEVPVTIAIRHHDTDIIRYTRKSVTLDTDGHRTVTTKLRLNRLSPVRVWSKSKIWRYAYLQEGLFTDGITIPLMSHHG